MKSTICNEIINDYSSKRNNAGQTVIETVFMILILLTIFFVIAEFSRAWYLKNSLNNAARTGVRVAAVTSGIATGQLTRPDPLPENCDSLTGNARVACAIYKSPGIGEADATLTVDVTGGFLPGVLDQGDIVTLDITSPFDCLVPLVESLLPDSAGSGSTMRHE